MAASNGEGRSVFASAMRGCRWTVILPAGVFSLGVNLLTLAVPVYMMQVFDRVLTSRSMETLVMLSAMALVALVAMAALEAARARLLGRLADWLYRRLAAATLARGLRAEAAGAGLRDLQIVRQFIGGPGLPPLLDAPWTPLFLFVVFVIHPALGLLAAGGAAVLLSLAVVNEWATRRAFSASAASSREAIAMAEAAARNVDSLEAMGMTGALIERWRVVDADGARLQARAAGRASLLAATARFLRFALQVATLGVGAWLCVEGSISAGAMLAASIVIARALAPAEQAIAAWHGVVAVRGAHRRLAELFSGAAAGAAAMTLPRPAGRLSVEQASFTPAGGGEPILRGVSFTLAAGEMLALIGPSAAGKTTLARLLVGSLAPSSGHVRLDGAELSAWSGADRGRHIGYLPQDVELFEATVRDNVARLGEAPDAAVIEAAQLAGAHELILRLPRGYETRIGAGAARLSGGQRQRVALARAVFGGPALVVLDEPNSGLDREGEEALMKALAALKARGATVVLIAHRPSALALADKVLLLREGRVEAFGERDAILAKLMPTPANVVAARPEKNLEARSRAHG